MLSQAEHQFLVTGVDQRARAMSAFFKDHYSGSKPLYQRNKVIPKKVIVQMLRRSSEETVGKVFPVNHWGFWYGPDIIRGPDGAFYVCEDNIGYVGGFGDLICARNSLVSSFPEFSPLIYGADPSQFYMELAEYYRSLVKHDEAIILLHYPTRMTADNEERRVRAIFKKHRIYSMVVPVPNRGKRNRKPPNKTLSITQQGVVVVHYKRKKQVTYHYKVGLVIIDAEPFDVDPKDSSVKRKMILDEAKYWLDTYKEKMDKIPETASGHSAVRRAEYALRYQNLNVLLQNDRIRTTKLFHFLRKAHYYDLKDTLNQGVPGLLDCYFQGLVQVVNGPGLDFVGDKLFCTYMDSIIEFYLKEKPILSTIPTISFCTGMGGFINELDDEEPANENESESADSKSELNSAKLTREERKIARQFRRGEREQRHKLKEEKAKFRAEKRLLTKEQRKQAKLNQKEEGTNGFMVDTVLLSQVFDHPEVQHHVVIKRVDGRGGDAVWVGPKISREHFLKVRILVEKNPEAFIVQKYCPLSQVDGQLVDIRCLANVGPDRVIVSQTFWGRGVPADGSNGKVNISDRGFEFCIATAKC